MGYRSLCVCASTLGLCSHSLTYSLGIIEEGDTRQDGAASEKGPYPILCINLGRGIFGIRKEFAREVEMEQNLRMPEVQYTQRAGNMPGIGRWLTVLTIPGLTSGCRRTTELFVVCVYVCVDT